MQITRGAFTAYILPESHRGTKVEYDDYFLKKVLPVAQRASLLIHEDAELLAYPASPLWGRTCLDRNEALEPLGNLLIKRLSKHHRFSHLADLRRVFGENDPATATEHFEVFLQGRGMMLNFWDVFFNVDSGLTQEAESRQGGPQGVGPPEDSAQSSPKRRIVASFPNLQTESIESLEDLSDAVCRLQPGQQVLLVQETLKNNDSILVDVKSRPPGHTERTALLAVDLMRLQMGYRTQLGRQSLSPLLTRGLKVKSGSAEAVRTGISFGPATDEMLLSLRNQDWAEKIEQHASSNRRGLLYVFGAAHLVDYDRFDGLLTLLRRRGFQVSLVR